MQPADATQKADRAVSVPYPAPSEAPGLAAAGAYLDVCVRDGLLPAVVLEIGSTDAAHGRVALGAPDAAMFDLASLTKVLGTGLLATHLVGTRRLDLDEFVRRWVPAWDLPDRADVRVRDLLAHASGLPAHLPLYLQHSGADAIVGASAKAPLVARPRSAALYSDLGFIVLGRVLELAGGAPLRVQVEHVLRRCSDDAPAFGPVAAERHRATDRTERLAWTRAPGRGPR